MVVGGITIILDVAAWSNWDKLFQGQPDILNDSNALSLHIVLGVIGIVVFSLSYRDRKKRG